MTVTSQGTGVALSGTLATTAERDSVVEIAKTVAGSAPVDVTKLLVAVPNHLLNPAAPLRPGAVSRPPIR